MHDLRPFGQKPNTSRDTSVGWLSRREERLVAQSTEPAGGDWNSLLGEAMLLNTHNVGFKLRDQVSLADMEVTLTDAKER